MAFIKFIVALAILSNRLATAQDGSCRVAAICGEGYEFNEITLNFTELSGGNGGVSNAALAQASDQLQNQFQDTLNTIQDQINLLQLQQAKLNECPSQTYSNFALSNDYVKYRGYVSKYNQWQMCGWVDYSDNGSPQTIMSYYSAEHGGEFYWGIRSPTQTIVQVPGHSVEFLAHASITGNHFICLSHDGQQSVSLSIDSSHVDYTMEVPQPLIVPEGGSLILGQRQSEGIDEPFGSGSITNFMVWPRVLTDDEINRMATSCACPKDYTISFPANLVERRGDLQFSVPQDCPRLPPTVVDGATSNQA